MAKKAPATTAPKTKATPKAEPKAAAKVKDELKAKTAPAKSKIPAWLKPLPVDYVVGTEDYAKLVDKHNELFGTAYNRWRVRPAVFDTIHETVWKHYDPKQYTANLRRG